MRIWQHHRTWLPHTQHCTLPLGTNRTGQQPQNDDQLRNRKSSICSSRHRG